MNTSFFIQSAMLGIGLAMDAFSVSLANGLGEPCMKKKRMCLIAGTFALFQFLMPMIGWFCVHSIAQYFMAFSKFIPWIALTLLCFIGINMFADGCRGKCCEEKPTVGIAALFLQGIATSIDALSVGFTISQYNDFFALVCCLIIALVTFALCMAGVALGKKFGTVFSGYASILGGTILIIIGVRIFITGVF